MDLHSEVWEKVVRRLRARQMPPSGEPRPEESTYDAVVSSLGDMLDAAAAEHPDPGRTDTFRRLNQTEYQNAIRDLFALDIDATVLLPADESSHGFDNVTVGDLSPTRLDRYISAAQKISRLAVGRVGREPGGDTIRIRPDLTQEEHVDGLPVGTRGGVLIPYTFPLDGEYDIDLRLARDRNEHVEGLAEPHELWALIHVYRKNYGRAVAAAERAAAIEPNNADFQFTLGWVRSIVGRHEEALAAMKKGMRLDPFPPYQDILHLGIALYFSGRPEEAIPHLKKVHEKTGYEARYFLIASYVAAGQMEEAKWVADTYPWGHKLSYLLTELMPFKNPADVQRILADLAKAGVK